MVTFLQATFVLATFVHIKNKMGLSQAKLNNDCDTRIFDDTRHVCGEGGYQYLYVVPHGVVKQPRGQRVYHVCVGDGDHYVGARCAQQ